ncbi:ABC transporter permease subunit [Halocatena pleomorpha]|uniref:ABC transporter permease n=1 Tax=Halocatena pleomorpha TaxID=1785090 RepID=A0A3P3RLE2_9EURY|nr:ABC transporter permease subunit [Halocatena pleomorpha]RRJ33680.1 ABC transporter permease [Halocatena pleomorpha]
MSFVGVVRKDLLDVRRSNLLRGIGLLYLAFTVLFFWGTGSSGAPNMYLSLWSMTAVAVLIVPLIALVAAYLSVAGERQSGNLKFLLSYPNSRRDVVLGKLIARSIVVGGAIAFAYVVGLALALYYYPDVAVGDFVAFVGLTLLYAVVYVSIAVGLSAATGTRSRAMGGAIGVWFFLNVFWNAFPINPNTIIEFVANRLGTSVSQNLKDLVWSLSPTGAYMNSMQLVFPDSVAQQTGQATWIDPNAPFYLDGWFMLVILAAWLVIPPLLGYWRFQRADLG